MYQMWSHMDCNIGHVNIYFHKVPVTITGKMTADYQMDRLILHAQRWEIGLYQIRTSHIVISLQNQSQHQNLHQYHANLTFVKFWSASKKLQNKYERNTSINSGVSLWLTAYFLFICTLRVFEQCHKVLSPLPFYEACKFDVCHEDKPNFGCFSIEAYSKMCAEASVCIPWRNATNGLCGRRVCFTRKLTLFWPVFFLSFWYLNPLSLVVEYTTYVQKTRSTRLVDQLLYKHAMQGNCSIL